MRKAVSVLPVPVGALMSTFFPRAMAGQPSRCTAVGSPTDSSNQRQVVSSKSARISLNMASS